LIVLDVCKKITMQNTSFVQVLTMKGLDN